MILHYKLQIEIVTILAFLFPSLMNLYYHQLEFSPETSFDNN